ncbi:hypothetical protein NSK_008528 [Nannochloropsis salina CCMP1776]|uniref:Mitochondrial inner membrane protease ATP23 n=1 Tax=Nannochloropsis salina CCMP1776 TaxID=1027361 RepID=A0A4D9CLJ2_9STRA|nr:hypothetical protein NSK_008528 [Nannochloropsis salina CCMP1776]|eukprot:TFJ79970.1 hypothetical protein NSK_008528 [Nannochloropsis salina CCMP1776]
MARPRPKALLDALADTGIQTLENVPESRRAAIAASTQRHQGTGLPDRKGGILRGNAGPGNDGGRERGLAEQGGGGGGLTLNIKCINCAEEGLAMKARAYMEAPPMSVVLCANRLQDRREMEEALVHELVHVYDHALVQMDLTTCKDLAYSEVRAAREAECHYTPQLCSWFKKQCVQSTATRSTATIFPTEGAACVAAVFEKAYRDVGPKKLDGALAIGAGESGGGGLFGGVAKPAPSPASRAATAASLPSRTFPTFPGSSSSPSSSPRGGLFPLSHAQPEGGLAKALAGAFGLGSPGVKEGSRA